MKYICKGDGMKTVLCAAVSASVAKNSLKIALVVGSVLNLINQSENFFHGGDISWELLLLNYFVPYCVASYSAARNETDSRREPPPK